ncbi:MAG: DUF1893 domain-containing protein [Clostridia bacterium]|nr:DUF1893 domain-containing protein [Clostridia bacterium]
MKNGEVKVYFERGIQPLLDAHARGELDGAVISDKVIGKAAALLAVHGGVAALHACLVSSPAKAVLDVAGTPYVYDAECARIVNRRGDGLCPMESAVMDIEDPAEALPRILQTADELRKKS